jgi:glutamate N-acetyltransferase/amino-acid N-acetyltransferase
MVIVMANGKAENDMIDTIDHPAYDIFKVKLLEMMTHLAKLIVSDGEGTSKFVEYRVMGAQSKDIARKMVRKISDSTLVKTALFGRDPNWGRIVCAAGNAGVGFNYSETDLFIGDSTSQVQVLEKGSPVDFNRNAMKKLLRESHIHIRLELNQGDAEATAWGSDMTTDYVMFNSVYTT